MILYPFAKINIGLRIIEKREDGFHNIETLFYPVRELTDILEIVEEESFNITVYGLIPDGDPLDNLCVKAYNLIKQDFHIPPVGIYLYKKIPFGAGLGGGSSDAAFTLLLLNKLFDLRLSKAQLADYASKLGSDTVFFIWAFDFVYGESRDNGMGMIATGRGEILTTYRIPQMEQLSIRIIKPPIFVSTAEAYSNVTPRHHETALSDLLKTSATDWKTNIKNDFEDSIFRKHPVIAEYKQGLYNDGAIYASMSGSGSALFGLFAK